MHFFILPFKDSTIYEFDKNLNTGLDACLEIDKRVALEQDAFNSSNVLTESIASRILIKFDLTEVEELIATGEVTASQIFLNLFAAEGKEIPLSYTIFAHPISQSWEMGTGFKDNKPVTSNGVTWNTKDGISKWISTSGGLATGSDTGSESLNGNGGTWFTSSIASQSFEFQTTDILMDVSDIVRQWLNNEIPNEGFIIKHSNIDETNEKRQGSLAFFSNETHTIFRPKLEFVWNDSVYSVPSSSTVVNLTSSVSTEAEVLTAVTNSFITGGIGSDFVNSGNPASGSLTIPSFSAGKQFELTSSIGDGFIYSAADDPVPSDTSMILFFPVSSSLSASVQSLVDEINNSTGSSVVTASLSGSDVLVLVAAFSGSDGNLITFSGSSVVLEGGTDLFVSESVNFFTESQFSFSQSLGIFTSCSFATESTIFISGSETFVSVSVTTESNCFFTASLGDEFVAVGANKATGSRILSTPISASNTFTLNSDVPDSFLYVATFTPQVDALPTFFFTVEAATASIPFTSILNDDKFLVSSSAGIFTFSASQDPVLPDTASSNIFGFKIGLTDEFAITRVSASDLFAITGSNSSAFEYSAALPWSIPPDTASLDIYYFGTSPSTGSLKILEVNSGDIFFVTHSDCLPQTIFAFSASKPPVPPDSASQNLFYFPTGSTLEEGVANLVIEINNSDINQFITASSSGSVLILSGSDDNITFQQECDSVTLANASISQSVQNLVDEINNSDASTFISASTIVDNGIILVLSSSEAPATFQSASEQFSLVEPNVSFSLANLVEEINNSNVNSFLSASIDDPILGLSASENGTTFQLGSSSFTVSGKGTGIQSLANEINNSTASTFVSASAENSLLMLTASRAGTSGNLIQFTGSSFALDGGTDAFISIGSESIFTSFSFDPNTGIYTSESFTFTSQSFTFTSESITSTVSSSFDQRQLDLLDDPVITITNLKEEYRQDSKARFNIFARERFPIKEFVTGSWAYTRTPRALPSSSFYSIRDAFTEDEIVPFSEFSKISFDDNEHFFNLNLLGFEPERFYRILLQVNQDGLSNIFDKDYIFKVIR